MKSNANLHMIRVLGRFAKALREAIEPDIRKAGFTGSQFSVLEALNAKGALTVSEVIDLTFSTDGNTGVVVNNLVKMGLIEKRASSQDRRKRLLSLTRKGKMRMAEYFPKHVEHLDSVFGSVSDKQKSDLITAMKMVGKNLKY